MSDAQFLLLAGFAAGVAFFAGIAIGAVMLALKAADRPHRAGFSISTAGRAPSRAPGLRPADGPSHRVPPGAKLRR